MENLKNEDLYNYEQVMSFAVIGLNNLLNSANKDNIKLRSLKMFMEPLPKVHKKDIIEEYADRLLRTEKEEEEKKEENVRK